MVTPGPDGVCVSPDAAGVVTAGAPAEVGAGVIVAAGVGSAAPSQPATKASASVRISGINNLLYLSLLNPTANLRNRLLLGWLKVLC